MLPYEVLELVFSYLPPKDLDVVPQVCRLWNEVASDKAWRRQFQGQFGTTAMTPVSTPFHKWRREVLCRRQVLQKWRRGAKDTDKTINSSLKDATDIYVNFAGAEASAYALNAWQGHGVAVDLERGKVRRRLYASKYSHETTPVSLVDGSRFGMVYGFFDGRIAGSVFSRDSTFAVDYLDFPYRHASAISAIWVAKTRSFAKPVGHTISVATGSQDGTVYLTNGRGYQEFRPVFSRVLLLEGCMYGSFTGNDGDSVVALYADGSLYQFAASPDPDSPFTVHKIAMVPLPDELIGPSLQLEQCNGCVVFRTRKDIHVVDLLSGHMTALDVPGNADITAFTVDMSYTPGAKCLVAGLATNEVCMWSIPPAPGQSSEVAENKIVLVNAKSAPKEREAPANDAWPLSSVPPAPEERFINPVPVWTEPNPIGYEPRLVEANKPQITQLATNAAVLLVGGYNGRVMAVDVLTGTTLRRIDSRISKTVLDFSRYSRDGFVPVTHLMIDSDPTRLRGLIAVRPAIQFFDMGKAGAPKKRTTSRTKRNSSKRRHRDVNLDSTSVIRDLNEEMRLNEEFAIIDAENDQFNSSIREDFALSDLEDDEQLEYAMMLSEQHSQQHQVDRPGFDTGEGDEPDFDEDLRRALELSRLDEERPSPTTRASEVIPENLLADNGPVDTGEIDEDEALRRAIALSLQPENF